jgi:hypothetical protein
MLTAGRAFSELMSLFGWAIQRFFTSAMDRCGPNGLIARGHSDEAFAGGAADGNYLGLDSAGGDVW